MAGVLPPRRLRVQRACGRDKAAQDRAPHLFQRDAVCFIEKPFTREAQGLLCAG
jgi:hypothetical protein